MLTNLALFYVYLYSWYLNPFELVSGDTSECLTYKALKSIYLCTTWLEAQDLALVYQYLVRNQFL